MGNYRLLKFECKKQLSSITFLIILAIFTVFAVSQLSEVFHMPVNSEQDIQALKKIGERDYIFVENSEDELILLSVEFLEQRIEDASIPQNSAGKFDIVFEMFESKKYNFDDVLLIMQDNEDVFPWITACKAQFGQKLGSVQEVNQMILSAFGDTGYSSKLYEKYVTYMQVIAAFIIFPIVLFLLTRDYRHGMYEIVYSQPINSSKYIILRYLGAFIPLMLYLYGLALILNLISVIRIVSMGYTYQYTVFLPYFLVYLLPTAFFLSSLIMVLILLFKKATAVFPIYAIYVILNVTPGVFGSKGDWIREVSPIIRLDGIIGNMQQIIINRIVYLVLGIIFLVAACKIYKQLKNNLRKGITI